MESLEAIFRSHHGKVSDKWSAYFAEYDRLLAPFRRKPVRLLEIGVQNGGSLEIWSRYFPNGEIFVGCDIDPKCSALEYDDPRIVVIVGDAGQDDTAAAILARSQRYDIVIDDGSHRSGDIVAAFARYFPVLDPGGLFIAEDLHCSYWSAFEGGLFDPFSAITFFKHLVDVVNHEHWGIPVDRSRVISGVAARYGIALTDRILATVGHVQFSNSICAVGCKLDSASGLGLRRVTGEVAAVQPAIPGKAGEHSRAPDQEANPWSSREKPSGEELIEVASSLHAERTLSARLSAELRDTDAARHHERLDSEARERLLQARIDSIESARLELEKALLQTRGSTSWRVTAPLRKAGTLLAEGSRLGRRAMASRRHHGSWLAVAQHARSRLRTPPAIRPGTNPAEYRRWIEQRIGSPSKRSVRTTGPVISIVMPTYNTRPDHLVAAIDSVLAQTCDAWELCIVDDGSTDGRVRATCEGYAARDARIQFRRRDGNGGIVAATNDAIAFASGEFIGFLDHDDMLHPSAIAVIQEAIEQADTADILYSDEDKIDGAGNRCDPFFKPDWSPHLAISQGYLGHLVCYRRSLIEAIGGVRAGLDGAQDHDLWLRGALKARRIVHVPEILYHWRIHEGSTAMHAAAKPYAHTAGLKAVSDYVSARYPGKSVRVEDGSDHFCYRLSFDLDPAELVSIIIPTRDKVELLRACIDSIREKSSWQRFEVIIVDNGSVEPETVEYLDRLTRTDSRMRVVRADIPFNWSVLNNIGARESSGSTLVFLNNDTVVLSEDWLQSLAGYASLPDVGTVGGLLLFPDGTIQHSGVVVGMGGWADHVFRSMDARHWVGPYVSPVLTRNVLAVTGACVAVARSRFEQLGGFDEAFLICGSDVELGLRAHKQGLYNVMCGDLRLLHFESKTRSPDVPQCDFEQSDLKYRPYRQEQVDPFYNPNLSLAQTRPTLRFDRHDT